MVHSWEKTPRPAFLHRPSGTHGLNAFTTLNHPHEQPDGAAMLWSPTAALGVMSHVPILRKRICDCMVSRRGHRGTGLKRNPGPTPFHTPAEPTLPDPRAEKGLGEEHFRGARDLHSAETLALEGKYLGRHAL